MSEAGFIPARPSEVVRSLLFYLAFYVGSVILLVGSLPWALAVPTRTRCIPDAWSYWHRLCVRWILGIRIVIEGTVPTSHALVAGKHESFFEAIDLPTLFDYPVAFAKAELMKIPVWGLLGRQYPLIPVEREQGAKTLRNMVSAARRLSAQGRVLVIFPEGTRVPHGGPAPLQAGFAGLYKMLDLPVVPFALNSGPLYHRRWKRRGTITIRFGEPIPPGLPREEVEARVQAAINVLNG